MLSSVRSSRPVAFFSTFVTGLLFVGALSTGSFAQTAPQLLPYTVTVVAGGGASATIAKGGICPTSGLTATDSFGDGCLATEIKLTGPRYALSDQNGNIFFSDYTNNLVRRIDAASGAVTAVAGGATSNPASGAACPSNSASGVTRTSTDSHGDGCLGTDATLSHPVGLAFAANGDLYFAENGNDDVRKVAADPGTHLITASGVLTVVVGNPAFTFGYNVNNTSTSGSVTAATNGYLNFPYGIAFDKAGNLYIGDEGNNAVEVVNLGTAATTVQGVSIPAGTIAKLIGYGNLSAKTSSTDCPDFVSTSSRGGCYFGKFTSGAAAITSQLDGPYSVALDANSDLFIANEFNQNVPEITADGIIHTFVGDQGAAKKATTRGVAGTFNIGSQFGVAADALNNVYMTDALDGVVWRVDAAGKYMYVVAGGASSVCSTAKDAYGDGCPATQATFGSSGTTFASSSSPGIFGVNLDQYNNLYIGDTITNLVRKISTGTQFGNLSNNSVTQTLDIHFAAGDSPAANAYTLTSGAANFTIGSANCTANSDMTADCTLAVTAKPTVPGNFSGTLQVASTLGGTATFALGGINVVSPATRTAVSLAPATSTSCTDNSSYLTGTTVAITAKVTGVTTSGSPTGTVTFYSNGSAIGQPQALTSAGTATLNYAFATANTYTITATYSGDSNYNASTGQAPSTLTISNPSFKTTTNTGMENSVTAGGTALYSFALSQVVYSGTITFACSGLPAGAACVFNPASISANGCSATNTVAMSITTKGVNTSLQTAGVDTRGKWPLVGAFSGCLMIVLLGAARRRGAKLRFGQISMLLALLLASSGFLACGNGIQPGSPTPSGTSTVTVTATGSTGSTVSTFTVPLTVK